MLEEAQRLIRKIVNEAKEACNDNPLDPLTWRDWAKALIRLSRVESYRERATEQLLEAKKKLKKALELDPNDLEAKWTLGEVYMHLTQSDCVMSDDRYKEHCTKAIECFNKVRAKVPDFRNDSNLPEVAQQGIDYVNSLSSPPELSPENKELLEHSIKAQEACRANPEDTQTWKDWCMSLVYMRGILEGKEPDKEMFREAKKQMKKALKNDPNDLQAMWSLGEVYMYIVRAESLIIEDRDLYKKYCTKAIECFDEVRDSNPGFCRGATGPQIARQGLELVNGLR